MFSPLLFLGLFSCFDVDSKSSAPLNPEDIPSQEWYLSGKRIYEEKCIGCHKADGLGSKGVFPPLKGSPWLRREPALLASILTRGLGGAITVSEEVYRSAMPPQELSAEHTWEVIRYIRFEFAQDSKPVSLEEIQSVHQKGGGTIYGEAELNEMFPPEK